ncbi:MAG: DUF4434 domain-containing protein [Armatimonadota bacterium]|nr:DUF4434 domain-containing protein [Armatimonadota bacterium]
MRSERITGSWLDFRHQNPYDGAYWNDHTAAFTCEQWHAKVGEMAALGMDTVVLMSTALHGKSFYPSRVEKERWELACLDPLKALLDAAAQHGMMVWVSVGYHPTSIGEISLEEPFLRWHRDLTAELAERYGGHPAFYGWYLPYEAPIRGLYPEQHVEFAVRLGDICRTALPGKPILIAPYGTRTIREDDRFTAQLRQLRVDAIAYQDEVGVRKSTVEEIPAFYAALQRMHAAAGVPLWADVEVFDFEGKVYGSPLIPAPMERVARQLASVRPYVEKILCYQYPGLMNPPESRAFAGHPHTVRLYQEYGAWLTAAT